MKPRVCTVAFFALRARRGSRGRQARGRGRYGVKPAGAAVQQKAHRLSAREPNMAVAPDAHHRIDIAVNPHRLRVIHGGITIADTYRALTLSETGFPDVVYFPRADVNMARLERSTHTSHCPYKGAASHYHLRTEEGLVENAAWSYEQPHDDAMRIKGHLAFYDSRVDRIDQTS